MTLLQTLVAASPAGVGFLDRDFRIVFANPVLAALAEVDVKEVIGRPVAEVFPDVWPALQPIYRNVVDTGRPVLNIEVARMRGPGRGARSWLCNYYPIAVAGEVVGIGVVVVDITERQRAEAAQHELFRAALDAVAATVEARDPYTAGHQQRAAGLAGAIAADLGLDERDVEGIRLAANIHDIGKMAIPSEILTRPGRLLPAEFELIKTHCQSGHEIIANLDLPWPVAGMILQHHERLDGSGYPAGLSGDAISLGARIVAVADVLEAMASHRPYRATRGLDAALAELQRGRATTFDADVVDSCVALVGEGRYAFAPHMSLLSHSESSGPDGRD